MQNKRKIIISLIINILIIIMEIIAIILSYQKHNFTFVKFYTQDSNVFALITSLIYVVYIILLNKNKISQLPKWLTLLKFMSTCMLTLTFLVVIFVLVPMTNNLKEAYIEMLFKGSSLFMHFLCPILAFITFVNFDEKVDISLKNTTIVLIPTIVYAVITICLNFMKLLDGPYPFLRVYNQPWYISIVWAIAIIGIAYLIIFLLYNLLKIKKTK